MDDPFPAVYEALRKLAAQRLAGERPGHTLQATALVHDVYLKLSAESPERWNNSSHFFNAAAAAMRHLLIDHARQRKAVKRGGKERHLPLTEAIDIATLAGDSDPDQLLAVVDAVDRLARVSPDGAEIVRLRFYAGLTVEQTATALGVTDRTVRRKWLVARA
jgi:RNA polymerase sigma factor (TIGR02999 family)